MRCRARTKRTSQQREAFTLMEILLVLAILVVVAVLAVPRFKTTLRDQQLRSAADRVRIEWNKAHIKAMKTGRIQVFRYEPGGRKFQVEPWQAADDSLEASANPESQFGQSDASPGGGLDAEHESRWQLPEGITFLEGESVAESRDSAVEVALGAGGQGGAWSRPILFYPDGVSSDAWVVVADEHDSAIRLELRGLTGLAVMGDLTTADEAQQPK